MSDTDYTDTFADADDNAIAERITDIKKWATYNIFMIDWNVMAESTRNFIDDTVRVTAEPDGYHMSIVLPDSDYAYDLGMGEVKMNLYKSIKFAEKGVPYVIPEESTTGIYPGLKLDRFDCSRHGDIQLSIRVDAGIFKWSDLTPCFRELDSVRSLEIRTPGISRRKLKIDSLDGFPAIKGSDEFTFRLSSIIYKNTNPVLFPVFFDDVIKNIRLRDTDPNAPSTVRIMVDYGMLSPLSPAEIYDGNYEPHNHLRWNGSPNCIRYMTWDAFREYVEKYAKPSTRAAMIHLINGWKEKSDIGAVFTVNDNNSLHSDTPWATCIAHVDSRYYVMNPNILERITAGR